VLDQSGGVEGILILTSDVTKRKQAEEALRKSEEKYRTVLEVNPDPVALYDIEGKVSYINPAFEQRFGWNFEEVVGKRIDFVPEENWPETKDAIKKMLSGKKIHSFETRRLNKEGKILDVQISSSLFLNRDGEAEGSIVTLRDITARKQAEEELVKAKEDLLSLSRTDSLTGILNRRAILSQIEIEIARAKREKKELSLSLLDIYHFN
jgi:PAS domain S-box-containing protein